LLFLHFLQNGERKNKADTAVPEKPETENSENPKGGFPVLPFAVTSGVILVSGIVVLAKRRKSKATKPRTDK
jgi:hypothetical protein